MELKRILARDSRSANEKAIQLYGRDVMIISSQRVDNQIELVVAIESRTAESLATQSKAAPSQVTQAQALEHRFQLPEQVQEEADSNGFGKFFQEAQLQPLTPAPAQASSSATGAAAAAVAVATYESRRSEEIVALLRDEIANLREDLLLSMRAQLSMPAGSLVPEVQQFNQALAEAGMPASMRLLLESQLQGVTTVSEAVSLVQSILLKTLKRKPATVPSVGRHALVGPTGAGKTLMIARLARMAAGLHGADRQALVSLNDARPGAWAQMQVLASQAGVDCYRAQDLDALKVILDDLGPQRSVWVDTAGMHFMTAAAELGAAGISVHAVMPVDVTATHAQKILNAPQHGWVSVMLTKFDEAIPSWALLKGLGESLTPVACISASSGVMGGVLPYDPRTLIDRALEAGGMQGAAQTLEVKKVKAVRSSTTARKAPVRKRLKVDLTKAVHG
jgi:flagellar biosynthesis protein FlhF